MNAEVVREIGKWVVFIGLVSSAIYAGFNSQPEFSGELVTAAMLFYIFAM